VRFKRGKGCVHCRNTGYFGRGGVYEIMSVDEPIRALMRQQAGASDLQRAAQKAGMKTLRESALRKLFEGGTTVEEVLRITSMHEASGG
jgi:general secretion pathway protein E